VRRTRLFFRRSASERWLFLEAMVALIGAKLAVHFRPFRHLAPTWGRPQLETPHASEPGERATAVAVSWAVQAVARHVPLGFVCLPQAIAAQRLLRRRGIASTLYLGVAPDTARPATITAHAWLRAGDKLVTGESEAARHRALAWFADFPS
jgi:hypothetical protein